MKIKLWTMFVVTAGIMAVTGCSGEPGKRAEPSKFNGSIAAADGKPVHDVTLQFLPQFLGSIQTAAKVGPDGKFSVDLNPGKYAFLIEPVKGREAAFKTIPTKFQNADKDNLIDVVAGQEINIKLN